MPVLKVSQIVTLAIIITACAPAETTAYRGHRP